ncbi:hypothetical protein FSP39_024365 [Pinctada imbricata]|uniref:E3 ubiquitin-protein ligase n=1 Tax=Pinctada imbricata TaxID=66713 RepID=A0AA89C9I5_PINIB|nr:hypothetical protein FSP39_024365 [Pinctada imbricata]
MDVCTDPKRLNCGHVFCSGCIAQQFSYKPSCPQCGAVYGKMKGNQPPGRVSINTSRRPLPGYTDCGSIEINYDIPAGYQREDHPSPGTMYEGINRSGHLPDTSKGRLVCKLLNVAFTRKLIFTIGHSRTTGKDGVVTWNDIHHKTRREGGPQRFGYPDKTYLDRVMEELTVKGVTEDSVDQDEHEEYTKAFSEHW